MNSKITLSLFATLLMLFFSLSASAKVYTLGNDVGLAITPTESDTITGSGNEGLLIASEEADGVYNITLKDMNLVSKDWNSAIIIENNSTGTMTVNFIIDGTNITEADNHGGIKINGSGDVNVTFSTLNGGTFTCNARYVGYGSETSNYPFQTEGTGKLIASIGTGINTIATLAGNPVSIEDAFSTTAAVNAFNTKSLVLSLSRIITLSNENGEGIYAAGTYIVTGNRSKDFMIRNNEVDDAVFNITLKDMTLNASGWNSALTLQNMSTGTMTVNFIIEGTNTSSGQNHAGISSQNNLVNMTFSSIKGGTLTCYDNYSASNAAFYSKTTLIPSVATNLPADITASATLAGSPISFEQAFSTEAAISVFTTSRFVITFAKSPTTEVTQTKGSVKLFANSTNEGLVINGLEQGEEYRIYNMTGKMIINAKAKSNIENVSIAKGVYLIKTANSVIKVVR